MVKKIQWRVVCPNCDFIQTYHSHNAQVKNTRTKECEKCGHQFACKKRRVNNLPEIKKKLAKEKEEKGSGFFKYSKSNKM